MRISKDGLHAGSQRLSIDRDVPPVCLGKLNTVRDEVAIGHNKKEKAVCVSYVRSRCDHFQFVALTAHRPQTNGIIERAVRVVKEGTSCVMVQSGLDEKWWPEAMNCFCFLRNVSTVLETGATAYKNRFGSDFSGPLIPFGAEVEYFPITSKDKTKQHAFGSKLRRGIFLGYAQHAGGGWNGDLFVVDWEELAAAQHFSDIHIKRFKQKEVTAKLVAVDCHKAHNGAMAFRVPVADGMLRQPGSSPFNSDNSDPFDRAGGSPQHSSDDNAGDDHWRELDPFDIEEESQQKGGRKCSKSVPNVPDSFQIRSKCVPNVPNPFQMRSKSVPNG